MVCHIIMFFMINVLLAPSGALVFILFYYIHTYIHTQQATFSKMSNSSDSKVLKRPNIRYIF